MTHQRQLTVTKVEADVVDVTPLGGPPAVAFGYVEITYTDNDTTVTRRMTLNEYRRMALLVGDGALITLTEEEAK